MFSSGTSRTSPAAEQSSQDEQGRPINTIGLYRPGEKDKFKEG